MFENIVADCSPSHFTQSDAPLLHAYVQSILLTQNAFDLACEDKREVSTWQQCARSMAVLAGKLRLCPHSRCDPRSLTRKLEKMRDERQWGPKG